MKFSTPPQIFQYSVAYLNSEGRNTPWRMNKYSVHLTSRSDNAETYLRCSEFESRPVTGCLSWVWPRITEFLHRQISAVYIKIVHYCFFKITSESRNTVTLSYLVSYLTLNAFKSSYMLHNVGNEASVMLSMWGVPGYILNQKRSRFLWSVFLGAFWDGSLIFSHDHSLPRPTRFMIINLHTIWLCITCA